jgi:hypothetical protein
VDRFKRPKGVMTPLDVGILYKDCKSLYDRDWTAWLYSQAGNLQSLFRALVPPDHRSSIVQMIKHASWSSLVYLFSMFQGRNDSVWFSPSFISHRWGVSKKVSLWSLGTPFPLPPTPKKKNKETRIKQKTKRLLLFY